MIALAQAAQLKAIEWHGLQHVPHGELEVAQRVAQSTLDAGLALAAYGSYYVVGESEEQGLAFAAVLQTAKALRAPMVRVWAGSHGPGEATLQSRTRIVDEAKRIADLAAEEKIKLVFEFHRDTLTETGASCAALLEAVDHFNAQTYWQPAPELDVTQNLAQLRQVSPWLVGLHVFHWRPTHRDRHPLAEGESEWAQYLAAARQRHDNLDVMLEFVKDGAEAQFYEDAAALRGLLAGEASRDGL